MKLKGGYTSVGYDVTRKRSKILFAGIFLIMLFFIWGFKLGRDYLKSHNIVPSIEKLE